MQQLNPATGNQSMRTTSFDYANWGAKTRDYAAGVPKNLNTDAKYTKFINAANQHVPYRDKPSTSKKSVENKGERAFLTDDPGFIYDNNDEDDKGPIATTSTAKAGPKWCVLCTSNLALVSDHYRKKHETNNVWGDLESIIHELSHSY